MSKKRPSFSHRQGVSRPTQAASKSEPGYWRARVFKNSYTSAGRTRHTRNWCVKIQHLGTRRTLSLVANQRAPAATEACQLYRTIRKEGWDQILNRPQRHRTFQRNNPLALDPPARELFDPAYWAQRLVRRDYTMELEAGTERELSARIDHQGAACYFPLATPSPDEAANRALRIYRVVAAEGWQAAHQRFSRELTVAFHWLDRPLAWTYTTIHSLVRPPPQDAPNALSSRDSRHKVSVIESDLGIQRALVWCVTHTEGFRPASIFSSAAEAIRTLSHDPARVALVSSNLADRPGALFLRELKDAIPSMACVLYSVYEDSEELFRSTPGGATIYLLQRTASNRFLAPLSGALDPDSLSDEQITGAVWQYFKTVFNSPPAGRFDRPITELTQREKEVLIRLSKGSPDKDIADRLGISIHTVHEHVRNIFEKLGVHNRTEAVVKFLQK